MEISVILPNQSKSKQPLQILKKIGEGKFSVYQTYCPLQKTTYALKAFPKDAYGANQYQKEALLANLSHPNIIQNIPISIENSEDAHFYPVLTEFAQYGDFFKLVVGGVLNSEVIMRTYFHQLIAAVDHMHSKKVAHLDLKLENLMMGNDFIMKIIDFDQAQNTTDQKLTSGGTKGFRAPEVINGDCTDFCAADIYSAGVILYAFKAQEYPFGECKDGQTTTLKCYTTFMRCNQEFWKAKSNQKKDKNFFSDSFKELINGMLDVDVIARFTIEDIKRSKWYKGPVLDNKALIKEMKPRWDNFIKNRKD